MARRHEDQSASTGEWMASLLKFILIAITLFGAYALWKGTAGDRSWFVAAHHLASPAPGASDGFFAAALFVSLGLLAFTALSWFPGLSMSGGQGYAYLAAARIMAGVSAIMVVALGLIRLGFGVGTGGMTFLCLGLVAIGIILILDRAQWPIWRKFRAELFDFYSVYVLKLIDPEKGEHRAAEFISMYLHKADTRSVRFLSVAGPALLAMAGIISAALVVQFGYGIFAIVSGQILPTGTALDGVKPIKFIDFLRRIDVGIWQIWAIVALVVAFWFLRPTRQLYSTLHPLLVLLGMTIFRYLHILAGLLMALYLLLVPASLSMNPWEPAYFGLLLSLVFFGTAALLTHAAERLGRRFLAGSHGLRTRKFWIDSYFILKRFPQPKNPTGYVIFSSQADTYTVASLLLVMCRMRQLGWSLIVMDEWPIPAERTGQKHIDRFFNVRLGTEMTWNFEWKIDWKNKRVEAAGMNFFHPIWEGMGRHFGRYTLDMPEGSDVERVFFDILKVADSVLLQAFRVHNTLAGLGKPVRIVGASAQFVPNAIWNIFCREVGRHRDMHFVWVQQGYQTYYADKARFSTHITLDNMTRKWPYSNPYLPHGDDFRAWMAKGQDVKRITERAIAWTKTNRATEMQNMIAPAREVYERIIAHRAGGKAVVCILGKMVFDLSTPWEKGPAHEGMYDWLNHNVEIARQNPDILYIVKPHPYESRPEIAGRVAQYFTDMIEQSIPANMIILAHDWFNLHALFPHIDMGVLWNGTSGLELGLHKVPCIICSDWGPVDYPVGLLHPKDRADYEWMMGHPREVKMADDFTEKCALLLEYTASDEVMIPYRYSARPITNEPFGPPYWFWDQVKRFIAEGDPNIDRACEKFR